MTTYENAAAFVDVFDASTLADLIVALGDELPDDPAARTEWASLLSDLDARIGGAS